MISASYDVIIVGSGPGGYTTAIRSAQLGFKTALVEREHLGGICLNWGCIPAKALLRSGQIIDLLRSSQDYGIDFDLKSLRPNLESIVERSRSVSGRLSSGVGFLMKKNKIDIIWGEAKVLSGNRVSVCAGSTRQERRNHPKPSGVKGEGVYTGRHIILATGGRPRILPGFEPDGKRIWTFFDALVPKSIPKSLLIMGSGAIGMEFASFYKSMGSDVTVVEILPRILPVEDPEISMFVQKSMEKQGIHFFTETKISALEKKENNLSVSLCDKNGKTQKIDVDRFLSAVGIEGNVDNLGLENLGVRVDKGCIVTDDYCRTNVSGIYAIGDVAGPPMLAHKAEYEGILCIEKISGLSCAHPLKDISVPACTYTHPEVASVGFSEEKAKGEGKNIRVGRFSFSANGKAIALGQDQGLIKTIFDKDTGQLLGVHMVGDGVTELIHSCSLAMNLETTEEELMHTIFPHPTLSEMIKESTLDAWGRALNS